MLVTRVEKQVTCVICAFIMADTPEKEPDIDLLYAQGVEAQRRYAPGVPTRPVYPDDYDSGVKPSILTRIRERFRKRKQ